MNADRRMLGAVIVELLSEGYANGEISDQAHTVLGEALSHLHKQEYHQQRSQQKYAGTNASTDKQLAICEVALPALDAAVKAYNSDDFAACIAYVKDAIQADGSKPKRRRR